MLALHFPERRSVSRSALGVAVVVLGITLCGCGRRGPPLPPLRVDPEPPTVLPLRQEDGVVEIRWVAPRFAAGRREAELGLREAVVLYRVVDLAEIAATERSSRGDGAEAGGGSESEPVSEPSEDESPIGEPLAGEPSGAPPGSESPPPGAEMAAPLRDEEGQSREAGDPPPDPDPDAAVEVPAPSEADPDAATEVPALSEADPDTATEGPAPSAADPDAAVEVPAPSAADPDTAAEVPASSEADPDAATEGPGSPAADPDAAMEVPASSEADPDTATEGPAPAEGDPDAATEGPGSPAADPGAATESPAPSEADPDAGVEVPAPSAADPDAAAEVPASSEADPDAATEGAGSPAADPDAAAEVPAPPEADPDAAAESGPDAPPSGEGEAVPVPEPSRIVLDTSEIAFEILAKLDSGIPGEERRFEAPVDPEWVGRRLEVAIRYEARGGSSEESPFRALDITGPLPQVENIEIVVGQEATTVRWADPRPSLVAPPAPTRRIFEVLRRRGSSRESAGSSEGVELRDRDVVWGEEVCYEVRLLVAGHDEERELPVPDIPEGGPVGGETTEVESAVPDPASVEAGGSSTEVEPATAEPASVEPGAADPASVEAGVEPVGVESAEVEPANAEPASVEPGAADPASVEAGGETAAEPSVPATKLVPIWVPPTGSTAWSAGPSSAKACVTPVDLFPPPPPSDLRLFRGPDETELSWMASPATDIAGYHVYRSAPDGSGSERLTAAPLEVAFFRDTGHDPEAAYRYEVTAVDRSDPPNESPRSPSALATPRR